MLTDELWYCHAGSLGISSKLPLHGSNLLRAGHAHLPRRWPVRRRSLHRSGSIEMVEMVVVGMSVRLRVTLLQIVRGGKRGMAEKLAVEMASKLPPE
jgi:hypothetical protein